MAAKHQRRAVGPATVEIDRRLLPDEKVKNAFTELKRVVDGVGEPKSLYAVEFLTGTNGFFAPRTAKAVAAFEAAIKKHSGRQGEIPQRDRGQRWPLLR